MGRLPVDSGLPSAASETATASRSMPREAGRVTSMNRVPVRQSSFLHPAPAARRQRTARRRYAWGERRIILVEAAVYAHATCAVSLFRGGGQFPGTVPKVGFGDPPLARSPITTPAATTATAPPS